MDVQFRSSTIEDLSELCSFSRYIFLESFKDTCSPEDMNSFLADKYNVDRIRRELSDPASSFFLLFTDGTLAGYIKKTKLPPRQIFMMLMLLNWKGYMFPKNFKKTASVHT